MSKQKHPILYNFLGSLLAGLILAAILYFVPGVSPWLVRVLRIVWAFVAWRVPVPLGLLFLLVNPIVAIGVILAMVALKPGSLPEFYAYKEDRLFNAVWRWEYGSSGIWDLASFCESCDLRLVYSDARVGFGRNVTKLICERCNRQVYETEGDYEYLKAKVEREIDRRIRTNEYKKSLKRTYD